MNQSLADIIDEETGSAVLRAYERALPFPVLRTNLRLIFIIKHPWLLTAMIFVFVFSLGGLVFGDIRAVSVSLAMLNAELLILAFGIGAFGGLRQMLGPYRYCIFRESLTAESVELAKLISMQPDLRRYSKWLAQRADTDNISLIVIIALILIPSVCVIRFLRNVMLAAPTGDVQAMAVQNIVCLFLTVGIAGSLWALLRTIFPDNKTKGREIIYLVETYVGEHRSQAFALSDSITKH